MREFPTIHHKPLSGRLEYFAINRLLELYPGVSQSSLVERALADFLKETERRLAAGESEENLLSEFHRLHRGREKLIAKCRLEGKDWWKLY